MFTHIQRLLFICFCVLLSQASAKDVYAWDAAPVNGDEVGVLVLCPGMNSNGQHFLSEAPWVAFAQDHRLGMIAISFSSDPDLMYSSERKGYYWPEQGSGEALLDAIRETYGSDLPILIYGFSGGAQFASRFVEWAPERILTWAAYSAQFWDDPVQTASATPPGVIACGELDSARWFPSFSYFYMGREQGRPWTWVSLAETGHHRKGSFERFIRSYFASIIKSSNPEGATFADIDTEEITTISEVQPELLTWLPSKELLEDWKSIHHQ